MLITYAAAILCIALNIEFAMRYLSRAIEIVKPLLIGGVLALALDGLVKTFERSALNNIKNARARRVLSVALAYVCLALVVGLMLWTLLPTLARSVSALARRLPSYAAEVYEKLEELCTSLGLKCPEWSGLLLGSGALSDLGGSIGAIAVTLGDAIRWIAQLFFAVVFSAFALLEKAKLLSVARRIRATFTKSKVCDTLYKYTTYAAETFERFIAGQLVEAVILGALCFAGMAIIRLPYALLISVLIAVTALIPIVGAYVGAVPSALLLLFESPLQSAIFLVFLIALQQFEGAVIYPKVVGEAIGLDGFFVFIGITLGIGVGGVLGVFVGVPLTAVSYAVAARALDAREKKENLNG
ncbi:MAG: AI-2E family transporter [Oscillospiraceae bacterium]